MLTGLATVFGAVSLFAFVCANSHERMSLWRFAQRTFVPLSKRDFWFPACPFCWLARAMAVGIAALLIL